MLQLLFVVCNGRLWTAVEKVLAEKAGDEQEEYGRAAEKVLVERSEPEYSAVVRSHYHQYGERPKVVHLPVKVPLLSISPHNCRALYHIFLHRERGRAVFRQTPP